MHRQSAIVNHGGIYRVLSSVSADPTRGVEEKKATTTWVFVTRLHPLSSLAMLASALRMRQKFISLQSARSAAERQHLADILSTDEIISVSRFWDNARRRRSCPVAGIHINLTKVFCLWIMNRRSPTRRSIRVVERGGYGLRGWLHRDVYVILSSTIILLPETDEIILTRISWYCRAIIIVIICRHKKNLWLYFV